MDKKNTFTIIIDVLGVIAFWVIAIGTLWQVYYTRLVYIQNVAATIASNPTSMFQENPDGTLTITPPTSNSDELAPNNQGSDANITPSPGQNNNVPSIKSSYTL